MNYADVEIAVEACDTCSYQSSFSDHGHAVHHFHPCTFYLNAGEVEPTAHHCSTQCPSQSLTTFTSSSETDLQPLCPLPPFARQVLDCSLAAKIYTLKSFKFIDLPFMTVNASVFNGFSSRPCTLDVANEIHEMQTFEYW